MVTLFAILLFALFLLVLSMGHFFWVVSGRLIAMVIFVFVVFIGGWFATRHD